MSSCREKQGADSSLCTLQKAKTCDAKLSGEGGKKKKSWKTSRDSSRFLMIQRKAFFNGLKKKKNLCGKSLSVGSRKGHLKNGHNRKGFGESLEHPRGQQSFASHLPEPSLHLSPPRIPPGTHGTSRDVTDAFREGNAARFSL